MRQVATTQQLAIRVAGGVDQLTEATTRVEMQRRGAALSAEEAIAYVQPAAANANG